MHTKIENILRLSEESFHIRILSVGVSFFDRIPLTFNSKRSLYFLLIVKVILNELGHVLPGFVVHFNVKGSIIVLIIGSIIANYPGKAKSLSVMSKVVYML